MIATDVLHRIAGTFTDVLDGVPRALADLANALPEARTELLDRPADALDQLRIAIERRQHAVDDGGHVVQPSPEQGLRLDPFDGELDLAELRMHADAQLHEIEDLGVERKARLQIV